MGGHQQQRDVHFLSKTQPAKPSSISHKYTLEMPPSKYLIIETSISARCSHNRIRSIFQAHSPPALSAFTHSSRQTSNASFAFISIFLIRSLGTTPSPSSTGGSNSLLHGLRQLSPSRLQSQQRKSRPVFVHLLTASGISTDSRSSSVSEGASWQRQSTFFLISLGFRRRRRSLVNCQVDRG